MDDQFKVTLTKEQKKHLKSVEWLLNDNENIATGRSLVLAICFLKKGIKNKGYWITTFDHRLNLESDRHLLGLILELTPEKYDIEINNITNKFRIK